MAPVQGALSVPPFNTAARRLSVVHGAASRRLSVPFGAAAAALKCHAWAASRPLSVNRVNFTLVG